MIPYGWQVRTIGDLVETVGGATPSTKDEAYWAPATYHWTSPKDLSGLVSPVLLDTERKISLEIVYPFDLATANVIYPFPGWK